jgi:hypothetical protein
MTMTMYCQFLACINFIRQHMVQEVIVITCSLVDKMRSRCVNGILNTKQAVNYTPVHSILTTAFKYAMSMNDMKHSVRYRDFTTAYKIIRRIFTNKNFMALTDLLEIVTD